MMPEYDVIVVGAGNAALAASVSARNAGADRVLVLEKAPEEMRGGNTHYSGGLLRIAFDSVEELLRLVPKARELARPLARERRVAGMRAAHSARRVSSAMPACAPSGA